MDMTSPAFCDECGAALNHSATHCPVCQQDLFVLSTRDQSINQIVRLTPVLPGSPTITAPSGGTRLTQRYILLKEVGTGGFGVVYAALDRYNRNQQVAIKQINLRNLSPREMIEATDSYNREVSLLARLKHKSLPHIIDHFTDSEHWYVVMDFINGQTLEDYLKQARGTLRPLTLRQVLNIGIALCDVLQYLHNQRPPIIFRDVKPGNIMYTRTGSLYLIDFGIARLFNAGKAHDTGALGSPGYAAPEQYGKAHTTPQTDIYGLGATLQTLFTGLEPPELAASPQQHRYWRRIPALLQPMLQKMMANDARERPTVAEVRKTLEHFREYELTGQKIKHTLAPAWRCVRQPLLWQLLISGTLTCTLLGSPLLIPSLLLVLCQVLGHCAMECYTEMAWNQSPLPWQNVLQILGSSTRQMLPFICLLLLYCNCLLLLYYNSSSQSTETVFFSSYLFFFMIAATICVIYLFYWIHKFFSVLARIRHQQSGAKARPLHQKMQYHRH